MEKRVIRNVASTAVAFGLSLSMAGSGTNTMLINGNKIPMANYSECDSIYSFPQMNSVSKRRIDNIYIQNKTRNVDKSANELFGEMRSATKEERDSVDAYIKSISKSTGVNFFDLC